MEIKKIKTGLGHKNGQLNRAKQSDKEKRDLHDTPGELTHTRTRTRTHRGNTTNTKHQTNS